MYNVVIGASSYGEMITDLLIDKNKLVTVMDKKENLQRINHKIVKVEVNTDNAKLVESAVNNQQPERVYVATEDDKLNLMLGELLADFNTFVLLRDEKLTSVADGNYKVICPSLLIKEFILREME
jgi:Trk K+ transport system NAD-binding subunit